MNDEETIADILREMYGHAKDGEFVSGYEVGRLADRVEAAYNRLAIPTPEQWTEFARQGSENARLREALREAVDEYCRDCADTNIEHCRGKCFVAKWRDALAKSSGESEVAKESAKNNQGELGL